MQLSKKNLVIWSIFAAAFLLLLGILWYLFHIEPAGHPDYSRVEQRGSVTIRV